MVDRDKTKPIELTTKNHSYDDDDAVVWYSEMKNRITSSNAQSIIKRRPTTPVARWVHLLIYPKIMGNSATRWGLEQEKHSVGVYTDWLCATYSSSPNSTVNMCIANPWLAAVPCY